MNLDFGASAFPGTSRFLEIAVRPAGVGSFTTLTPRQLISSTPYAVRALNAATADSVPASGVPSGSGNYIQNSTSPQSSSNFNISGNGTAAGSLSGNIVNATTQYNLNGERVLIIPGGTLSGNMFAGISANNSLTGTNNIGFGYVAGASVTTGNRNSLFGSEAGSRLTAGSDNAAFGFRAGDSLDTTNFNTFFGTTAGQGATGNLNTFVGANADFFSLTQSATNGNRNTLLGANASVRAPLSSLDNATAIGANAEVDQSNSLVLGSINGVNGATADTKVGIGTTTPTVKLSVVSAGDGAKILLLGTERPWVFKQFGTGASTALELSADDSNNNNKNFLINTQGNVGIGTQGPLDKLHVFGDIRVGVTGTNGCLKNNNGGTITGTCSSDLRFKRNLVSFGPTLQKLTSLQPKYFFWRTTEFPEKNFGAEREAGLIAQEVEQVMPELVSEDADGFKQVDYSKLPLMLLQAVKEQQKEIEQLKVTVAQLKLKNRRQRNARGNR